MQLDCMRDYKDKKNNKKNNLFLVETRFRIGLKSILYRIKNVAYVIIRLTSKTHQSSLRLFTNPSEALWSVNYPNHFIFVLIGQLVSVFLTITNGNRLLMVTCLNSLRRSLRCIFQRTTRKSHFLVVRWTLCDWIFVKQNQDEVKCLTDLLNNLLFSAEHSAFDVSDKQI